MWFELKNFGYPFLAAFGFSLVTPRAASAHRDDYIDETLVYLTLEKGEIEPEYFLDVGRKPNEELGKQVQFIRNNFACEYGITEHWMVDGRLTVEDARHDEPAFQASRFETRYRFFEEGERPLDVAVSGEFNTERSRSGRQEPGVEPRLIVSKDFGQLNLTSNLPVEIPLRTGSAAFLPSFGFRYNTPHLLRFGAEVKHNTHTHEDAVVPQIWFALPHEVTIKLGFSFGFNRNKEDFGRIAFEVGL